MATTTNYGWTTPDNTDLVKDGASAIRTLGSSIDTTLKAQIDAQIPDTLLTTTGDVIYASAANTPARLGIGTAGQILSVSSGLPAWTAAPAAGSLTLLSTTTLSGATVTISGISSSYKHLYFSVRGVTNASANGRLRIAPNGNTGITTALNNFGAAGSSWEVSSYDYMYLTRASDTLRTSGTNAFSGYIYNYATANESKNISINGYYTINSGAVFGFLGTGGITTSSAISSLVISSAGGDLSTGTFLLYGVN